VGFTVTCTYKNMSHSHEKGSRGYTKYDIWCLIVFSVVTTLSCSTLNFNSLIISLRHKCAITFPTTMSLLLLSLLIFFFHIISLRHKCATTFPTIMSLLFLSLLNFFHIISVRHKCATTFPTTKSLLLLSLLIILI
jgi:hypothetical protein